ncbi:MAG: hypothetical protein LBR10_11060 [Prevotellaceae bacterium]|jgi:hypothetical protein|nr:hypothetical protein [Prevotellaceae bacterium]
MTNIDTFFDSFVLKLSENYPRDSKMHFYADYFELVSLFNKDNIISVSEMLDRLKDEGIIKQEKIIEHQAEKNDDDEIFVREVFNLLEQRNISFGNDYPFIYSDERLSLKSDINNRQKVYIFLLLASNLNLFKDFQSDLTTEFELISQKALENYLPDYAVIKGFGKNSEFTGYICDKIRQLAKIMNLRTNEEYLKTISSKGTQDLGLDIVGWLPFNDNIGNYISVFCQCACGKDWNKKLNETRRYNKFLNSYLSNITHSLFIPYSLINYNDSVFFEHHEFGEPVLLFERKRILSLIEDKNIYDTLNTKELIEKCVTFEENIV